MDILDWCGMEKTEHYDRVVSLWATQQLNSVHVGKLKHNQHRCLLAKASSDKI